MKVVLRLALALLAVSLGSFTAPSPAAARGLVTGFGDALFHSADSLERDRWLGRAEKAGAGIVRVNVRWSAVAGQTRPADPADPADPAYDFAAVDGAVRSAAARGLRVMLTIYRAPDWAEGPGRPTSGAPPGTWRPRTGAFGAFARAVARRYSGAFAGLPRVRHFECWNEPNLSTYLTPQRIGKRMVSPGIYRKLLNAMGRSVRAVHPDNAVVAGGTGPYGNPTGDFRIGPVAFFRELLCLKGQRKLVRKSCPVRARFDILSHHPISTSGGPGRSALSTDDASTPDMGRVARVLRRAEALGTVAPSGRRGRPLWVTEFWWKSNPPDNRYGVTPRRQARWVQESLFRFWRSGVTVAMYMFIVDRPMTRPITRPDAAGSGLYFVDGRAKPALRAFRFPLSARRVSPRKALLWSKVPASGKVVFERKGKRKWNRLAVRKVKAGSVVTVRLRLPKRRKASLIRARTGSQVSLGSRLR